MAKRDVHGRFTLPEFVFIILLLVSGTILGFSSGGFVISFQRVGFTVVSTLQKGVFTVTNGIKNSVNAVAELSRLREENRALTERLKNYEYMQRNNTEIRKENQWLKEQLGFSYTVEQKNFPAQIIARDLDRQYTGLTINKGSSHGIKKNMPVIAIQNGTVGLVGKVVTVSFATSLVMPVYDSKFSISARIQNTRDIGLLAGRGSSELSLSLQYIKKRVLEELNYGDIIVTSGETANYVRDIPVGYISKISVLDYDSSLNIEITPVLDFARLENVIVTDLKEVNPQYGASLPQTEEK